MWAGQVGVHAGILGHFAELHREDEAELGHAHRFMHQYAMTSLTSQMEESVHHRVYESCTKSRSSMQVIRLVQMPSKHSASQTHYTVDAGRYEDWSLCSTCL